MKRKIGIAKAILSWTFMVAFLLFGVIATQMNKRLDLEGNFKFDAKDVKAEISVSEAFIANPTQAPTFSAFDTITLNENKQTAGSILLGTEGVIEFTSASPIYVLKIEVKNTFKPGGRNIYVDYDYFPDYIDNLEVVPDLKISPSRTIVWENGSILVYPNETLTILLQFILDTDFAESFDTANIENFELAYLSLVRG